MLPQAGNGSNNHIRARFYWFTDGTGDTPGGPFSGSGSGSGNFGSGSFGGSLANEDGIGAGGRLSSSGSVSPAQFELSRSPRPLSWREPCRPSVPRAWAIEFAAAETGMENLVNP